MIQWRSQTWLPWAYLQVWAFLSLFATKLKCIKYVMLLLCSPKVNILPRIKWNLMRNTYFLLYAFALTIILDTLESSIFPCFKTIYSWMNHTWLIIILFFYLLIIILGTSIIWMGLQWNRHQIVRVKHS